MMKSVTAKQYPLELSCMDDHSEFLAARQQRLDQIPHNQALGQAAEAFLVESIRSSYSYHFDWMGLPIIQYPQDLVALQEIIWQTRPDCIIETGIARGGSLIFYASMLELLGAGQVLGIDIDIRAHNRARIEAHPLAHRIQMIAGSSIAPETLKQVRQQVRNARRIMVCLDSNHTHAHVLKELELYTPFVSPGLYCVVFDTIIDLMPDGYFSDRPWNQGNSPGSAIQQFLRQLEQTQTLGEDQIPLKLQIDTRIDQQLLISACRGGYLKRLPVSSSAPVAQPGP